MERDDDDGVPPGLLLDLDEAIRVLDALQDALDEFERGEVALGLQDELVTLIRLPHHRLGLNPGGPL